MVEQTVQKAISHRWYARRPVFFVSNVHRALAFFIGKLAFSSFVILWIGLCHGQLYTAGDDGSG